MTADEALEPTFVDTNILVYANVDSAPLHALARDTLNARVATGGDLWISRQVLREYLATLSRPQSFTKAVSNAELIADVERFQAEFLIAEDGPSVTEELTAILMAFAVGGKQIPDANVVATMLADGIRGLLTHNASDFARFSGLIRVDPLVPAP